MNSAPYWRSGKRGFANCSRLSNALWQADAPSRLQARRALGLARGRQAAGREVQQFGAVLLRTLCRAGFVFYLVKSTPERPSILDAPPAAEALQSAGVPLEKSPPTTLWLIRHAEVEERYQNVFGGRINMGLSRQGHAQAQALGRFLQNQRLDALYASPMKRVQQTLAPLLAGGSITPIVLAELREVDFGDWTGLHWTEVQARYGISALAWLDQLECAGIPNAECARTFRARVEPSLRELLAKHAGEHLALACHGGVIRMLLAILLELPLSKMAVFEIDYASVTQVLWTPPIARLQLVNFAPWRDHLK